jgi:putrescine:ornithine antiporter
MFPAFFSKVNSMSAPVVGMIVMGIVQTVLALSTISPSLSEQFSVLVNLAVVTNVIPYIIALSALMIIMRKAGVPKRTTRINSAIAVVGMLYSTYAIYASGATAVIGAPWCGAGYHRLRLHRASLTPTTEAARSA